MRLFKYTFLRSIFKGDIKKYVFYAVGEIIIIILGIFFAIQLNNWNQDRANYRLEKDILKQIQNDLIANLGEIQSDLEGHESRTHLDRKLEKLFFHNNYSDTLISWVFMECKYDRQVYPLTSGYNHMKQIGSHLIRNDSIRTFLYDLYELTFTRLVSRGQDHENWSIIRKLEPHFKRHFSFIGKTTEFENPLKVQKNILRYLIVSKIDFINDRSLLLDVREIQDMRREKIRLHKFALEEIGSMLKMIETEMVED